MNKNKIEKFNLCIQILIKTINQHKIKIVGNVTKKGTRKKMNKNYFMLLI